MPSLVSHEAKSHKDVQKGLDSSDASKPPRQKGRGRPSLRSRSDHQRTRSEDRVSYANSVATEISYQADLTNGNISDSPDSAPNGKKSSKKGFGGFTGLQKIVNSISSSSPNFHRRSKSVTRDDRRRGAESDTENTMTKSSTNFSLDKDQPPSTRHSNESILSVLSENPSLVFPRGRIPGAMGIFNHGNTCFINAVIHCLSNTRFFVEYFLTGEFRKILPSNQTVNGTRCQIGRLTESLFRLFQNLWSSRYDVVPEGVSARFKQVVGEYESQYEGFAQNDAQEFLLFLLNKVHEELRRDLRHNNQIVSYNGGTVYNNNNKEESSVVYDLFQAKYRSTLICPSCGCKSKTHEPFLSVSLPIQQKQRVPILVTVVRWTAEGPRYQQFGLQLNHNDLIKDLRQAVVKSTGLDEDRFLMISLRHHTFHRTLHDLDPISYVENKDIVYAVEIGREPEQTETAQQTALVTIVALANTYTLAYRKRVGHPFAVQVSRDVSLKELQMALMKGMKHMIKDLNAPQLLNSFEMKIVDGSADSFIDKKIDLPLFAECVESVLNQRSKYSGPQHVKIIVEWPYKQYKNFVNNVSNVDIDISVKSVKSESQQTNMASLQDCLHCFTQQERLGSEDAWRCEKCRKSQHGTIKTLRLCSLPDVLIIHLKRFKQVLTSSDLYNYSVNSFNPNYALERRTHSEGEHRTKLETLIQFPIEGLDMNGALEPDNDRNGEDSSRDNTLTHSSDVSSKSTVYDLYAVCNHVGSLQDGHYTAYCRSPVDNEWYFFDDNRVSRVGNSNKIIKSSAYLLFYQKRSTKSRSNVSLKQWLTKEFNSMKAQNLITAPHNSAFADIDQSCDEDYSVTQQRSILNVRNDPSYSSLRKPNPRPTRAEQRYVNNSDIVASSTPLNRRSQNWEVDSYVGTSSEGLADEHDGHKPRVKHQVSFAPPPVIERPYSTMSRVSRRSRTMAQEPEFSNGIYANGNRYRLPTHSNDVSSERSRKVAVRSRRSSNGSHANQSFERRESRRLSNSVDNTPENCTEIISARPKQPTNTLIRYNGGNGNKTANHNGYVHNGDVDSEDNQKQSDDDIEAGLRTIKLDKPRVREKLVEKQSSARKPNPALKFVAVGRSTENTETCKNGNTEKLVDVDLIDLGKANDINTIVNVERENNVGDLIDLETSFDVDPVASVSEHTFANGVVRVRLESSLSSSYTTYQYDIGKYVLQESSV